MLKIFKIVKKYFSKSIENFKKFQKYTKISKILQISNLCFQLMFIENVYISKKDSKFHVENCEKC